MNIRKEEFLKLNRTNKIRIYLCARSTPVPARILAQVANIRPSNVYGTVHEDILHKRISKIRIKDAETGMVVNHYSMTERGKEYYQYLITKE